jgi:hypothetical protein
LHSAAQNLELPQAILSKASAISKLGFVGRDTRQSREHKSARRNLKVKVSSSTRGHLASIAFVLLAVALYLAGIHTGSIVLLAISGAVELWLWKGRSSKAASLGNTSARL